MHIKILVPNFQGPRHKILQPKKLSFKL